MDFTLAAYVDERRSPNAVGGPRDRVEAEEALLGEEGDGIGLFNADPGVQSTEPPGAQDAPVLSLLTKRHRVATGNAPPTERRARARRADPRDGLSTVLLMFGFLQPNRPIGPRRADSPEKNDTPR